MPNLDRQTLAPTVLLTRKLAGFEIRIGILIRIEHARHALPFAIADTDPHSTVGENVLNPMRFVAVLGQDVEPPVRFNEPDFNLAWHAGFAPGGRQVEEWSIGVHGSSLEGQAQAELQRP